MLFRLLFLPVDTVTEEQMFRVYLRNIPADLILEESPDQREADNV